MIHFVGLPRIPPERQSHYVREFLFVCRVLLERKRLAAQEKVLPVGAGGPPGAPEGCQQSGTHPGVLLETELRVPILQLRDSLGLFRDRSAFDSVDEPSQPKLQWKIYSSRDI